MERDESPPIGHSISCKSLRNEGLHIFRDIIKYCMKDNGEKHFEFARVSTKDMNDGTVEYMKFEKVHLNNYNESLIATFPYQEAFGCCSSQHFVPRVEEWTILSKFHMSNPNEVRGDGCHVGSLNMEHHDEPT